MGQRKARYNDERGLLVVFALFRYLYLIIQKGQGSEPADLLFQDRPFLIPVVLWGMVVLAIQLVHI
jgi:hypothetical protein